MGRILGSLANFELTFSIFPSQILNYLACIARSVNASCSPSSVIVVSIEVPNERVTERSQVSRRRRFRFSLSSIHCAHLLQAEARTPAGDQVQLSECSSC